MLPHILLFLFAITSQAKDLQIHFFNVGGADSQLIVFPSGYSILIDAGEPVGGSSTIGGAGTNGKYIANRIYKILGKKKVDVFLLSHFHCDHSGYHNQGGIWYLIEKAGFTFGKFLHRNIGKYQGQKLTDCTKNSIKWLFAGAVSTATWKFVCYATSSVEKTKLSKIAQVAYRCSTTQINPPDADTTAQIIIRDAYGVIDKNTNKFLNRNSMAEKHPVNENDFSICLKINFGKFGYCTCGDLSGYDTVIKESSTSLYHDVETSVAPMIGEVDLMKVNHHGSSSSTNPTWAKTLRPTVAVSSCADDGAGMAKRGMTNLKNVNATVYTTGKAEKTKGDSYFDSLIRMGDDVVVKVPENGDSFTVSNSQGKNKRTFKIKQNKKSAVKCHALEDDV